jgi:hypothetical protein
MKIEPGNPPVMTAPPMRMKWPENSNSRSSINGKACFVIAVMPCQEPLYRQYAAEKQKKWRIR